MELTINILLLSIPLLVLSWRLPEKWQIFAVSLATAFFLGLFSPVSLVILLLTSTINYHILKYISSKSAATLVVVLQMATIFVFFKLQYGVDYLNFGANRVIPLGFSFYSFRQIHYALESYKRQLPPHGFWDFFRYMFFLPTILIGPINRFHEFHRDLQRRRWDAQLFSGGLERILYGFVKIIILGNYVFSAKLGDLASTSSNLWVMTYLDTLAFSGNAYLQFAGYSDIAIGLSMLFGFKIIENFNYPFLATNIADFWARWHISLSAWCRDYVYLPFLGITRNAYVSIVVSMLVLGIWHEISIRYILWGTVHALAINIWHRYNHTEVHKFLSGLFFGKLMGIIITIHFVMFSFILIKEETLTQAWNLYMVLIGLR